MSLLDDFKKVKLLVDDCDKECEIILNKLYLTDPFNLNIIEYIIEVPFDLSEEFRMKVFLHFIKHFPYKSIFNQPLAKIMNGEIIFPTPYHYF